MEEEGRPLLSSQHAADSPQASAGSVDARAKRWDRQSSFPFTPDPPPPSVLQCLCFRCSLQTLQLFNGHSLHVTSVGLMGKWDRPLTPPSPRFIRSFSVLHQLFSLTPPTVTLLCFLNMNTGIWGGGHIQADRYCGVKCSTLSPPPPLLWSASWCSL